MKLEATKIEFASEAEVRSKAEHQRTEEILAWLKMAFAGWRLRRRERSAAVLNSFPPYVMSPARQAPKRIA